jgi:hypothetical protein
MLEEIKAIAATLTSLQMAGNIVNSFLGVRGAIQEQGKIFELQRVILDARQSALDTQATQTALLQRIADLEAKIVSFDKWERESENYTLTNVGTNSIQVFAYAYTPKAESPKPFHLLCAKCYEHRSASVLQATHETKTGRRVHFCPECKTEFVFRCAPGEPTNSLHQYNYDPFQEELWKQR